MTDLLTRIASLPTLRAAFDRVRDNRGCAGADGVSIAEFERDLDVNLFALEEALREGNLLPSRLPPSASRASGARRPTD